VQRVADEAAPLRPPRVLDVRAELRRDQLRERVLEALLRLVRERQVVRVGADAERPLRGVRLPAGKQRGRERGRSDALTAVHRRLLAAAPRPDRRAVGHPAPAAAMVAGAAPAVAVAIAAAAPVAVAAAAPVAAAAAAAPVAAAAAAAAAPVAAAAVGPVRRAAAHSALGLPRRRRSAPAARTRTACRRARCAAADPAPR